MELKESVLKEQTCDNDTLEIEMKTVLAAIGCGERVIHTFVERVCTSYNTSMRA